MPIYKLNQAWETNARLHKISSYATIKAPIRIAWTIFIVDKNEMTRIIYMESVGETIWKKDPYKSYNAFMIV